MTENEGKLHADGVKYHVNNEQLVALKEFPGSLHNSPLPPPPRAFRDWYQNVPQDVNFDILDVPKKITLAKFGFLSIFVQPCDEKMTVSGMGGGDA